MNDLTGENLISKSLFEISSSETDMEARISPGSLVNLLIQSAIKSADKLGFGFGGIRQQQLFWVLSRIDLEIYRPLKWYDKVEVETWPKNVEKILYLRDYILRDKENSVIAKATSGWLAIDNETHRAKKIEGIDAGMFIELKDKHGLSNLPSKLEPVPEGETFEFTAYYSDIDLNKHLSATRYIDRMMDTFPADFHINHYPSKLSVNYMKETMPGETLKFVRLQTRDNEYSFEVANINTGINAFRGKVEFVGY
jgi:medium-chain acyl-[acyl-carrier-protein] hydrolase